MIQNPNISVIMPTYNAEKYLKEAIESILNQTYINFEFIIINDGSTDNSLNIINKYANIDKRIKVISRENRGLVYSLNEGISLSRGEFIARMDSDDISLPQRLEEQVTYMQNNRHISIIGTLVEVIGDGDSCKKQYSNKYLNWETTDNNIELMFLRGYSICHPTFFMRRDDILNNLKGYSNVYGYAEDYELLIRALKNDFKMDILQKKLLKYRLHENNKSIKDNLNYKTVEDIFNIKLDYMEDLILNKKECIIWGAGNGGKIAYDILKNRFHNIEIKAFIDKFKIGENINNINIYDVNFANKNRDAYFFISTTPGKDEAELILKSLGLKEIQDFISLV